jgi:hypothetical protein
MLGERKGFLKAALTLTLTPALDNKFLPSSVGAGNT